MDTYTPRVAANTFADLYKNVQDWGQDEHVKSWILTVFPRIAAVSDKDVSEAARGVVQDLHLELPLQYTYPLRARLPYPNLCSLLFIAQKFPEVEDDLGRVKRQRLEQVQLPVYIPLWAKANLQDSNDKISPLMGKITEFLASDRFVMLIQGESGAGKTTFSNRLEYELLNTYTRGGPIPLFINLATIDRPNNELIGKQSKAYNFSDDQIQHLKQFRQFILVCDGYDEGRENINYHNTNKLNQPDEWNVKMVISSRSQYLGKEYRRCFMPMSGSCYSRTTDDLFQEAVIVPFSREQIISYIDQFAPLEGRTWTTDEYLISMTNIPGLMDHVKNPFVLKLALDSLPHIDRSGLKLAGVKITRAVLYDTFAYYWIDFNKRQIEGMTLPTKEKDALDTILRTGFHFINHDFLKRLARAIAEEQSESPGVQYVESEDKNTWRADFFGEEALTRMLRDSALLTRTGHNFRFVHQSVQEYFYSCTICSPLPGGDTSGYFASWALDYNGPLFKKNLLRQSSVMEFLVDRVKQYPDFVNQLRTIVEQSKIDAAFTVAATNAITILVRAGVHFNGVDLQGIRIPGADLSGGQFDSVKFQKADLTGVNFTRTWLRQVDFTDAKMKSARFGQLPSIESANAIESGAYSPDGSMVALGEYDGGIEVIDTTNWNKKYLLSGHSKKPASLAFSPNSRQLVSGGHDAGLRLWDLTRGECLFVMQGHDHCVNEVRFSPCDKMIASASHDHTVRIWDAETGKNLHVLEGHANYVLSVDFSPDGRRPGSASEDGTLRFWDAETGDAGAAAGDYGPVYKFAWSPSGEWMAISRYNTAEIRDCHHLGLSAVLEGHVGKILNLAYSPNGDLLVTAGEDHTVRVWDTATGAQVSLFTGHEGYVNFCTFSSDGQRIASGGDDGRLRLWDVFGSSTPTTGAEHFGHLGSVSSVNYTPDGKSLFSSSGIGEVRNWVASTGAAGPVEIESVADLLATAISPDGTILAGGGRDDTTIFQLWDCRTGAALRTLKGHDGFIYDLAFSPCSRWIASASADQTARLWDLQDNDSKSHTLVKLDRKNSDCPRFVAFSPMTENLAIGFRNSAVHLYHYWTKRLLKIFQVDNLSLGSMDFSPSSK